MSAEIKTQQKKRIGYIDIAKGIAMLCIIAGHFGFASANRIVYTFHVPLFFLLSGYFISTKLSLSQFANQKARQLLAPYYITGLAIVVITDFMLLCQGLGSNLPANTLNVLKALCWAAGTAHTGPIAIQQIGLLWFLWALFWGLLIVRLSLNSKYSIVIVLAFTFAGYASSQLIWLPLSIQPGCVAAFFIYLGHLARKYKILEKKQPVYLAIAAIVIWMLCIYFNVNSQIVGCEFSHGIISIVGALCGSYSVILFSKFLEKYWFTLACFLNFVGQTTLVVMCFHAISDFCFPNLSLYGLLGSAPLCLPHTIISIVIYLLNVAWPLCGVFITMHVPALKSLFSLRPIQPLTKEH